MNVELRESKPIHVCFVIDSLSRAGTETQLLALIKGLDRSRVMPSLCLLKGAEKQFLDQIPSDCPTLILGLDRLLGKGSFKAALRLRRFWAGNRVDVVQTYFLDSTYFAVPLARFCGYRKVVRVRNNIGYWLTKKHQWLGRFAGRLCLRTLTNSEEGQTAICRSEFLPRTRVPIILNGVDLDRFDDRRPPRLLDHRVVVGMVGNLRPVKNVDGLIRALAPVMQEFPGVNLQIAGEGEQRSELERLITHLGLTGRVLLKGAVHNIPGFLKDLDVAVLPSHSESLSNALLEYMAAEKAIIATNVGANAKVIRHEIDGLIVAAGDDRELELAMRRLLDSPETASKIGRNARLRVEANFSRATMLAEFASFYERLGD